MAFNDTARKIKDAIIAMLVASKEIRADFYATIEEGVADTPVGGYFSSNDTGELRIYKRISQAPWYTDQGDSAAPLTKSAVYAILEEYMSAAVMSEINVVLTAQHIAGTTPLLAAKQTRKAVLFGSQKDFSISLSSGATTGLRVYGSARDDFAGWLCPRGNIFIVSGSTFVVGDVVVIWEAE